MAYRDDELTPELFPGGKGTASMRKIAKNRDLIIFERYAHD